MAQEPNVTDERKSFLLEAIKDGQATIRALDFKANALLVVLALLLTNANKVAAAAGFLSRRHDCLGYAAIGLAIIAVITGVFAVWFAVLTLAAQFDPRSAVDPGEHKDKPYLGSFFAGGYYAFLDFPFIFGRFERRSSASLETHLTRLPVTSEDVVIALAYEQLKLAFIRDSKAKAIRISYALGVATLAFVLTVWLCGIMTGSDVP
jgi:hypothetical protein